MMNPWMTNWMNKWHPNSGLSGLGSAPPQNVSMGSASSSTPWANIWGSPRNMSTVVNGSFPNGYTYNYPRGSLPPMGNLPPPWGTGSGMPSGPPTGTILSAPPTGTMQPASPAAPVAPTGNSYLSQPQQPQAPVTTPDQSSGGGQALMGRGKYPFAGMTIGNMPKNNGFA